MGDFLAGKVVAVTGAGCGIGRAVARAAAAEDAKAAVNDYGVAVAGASPTSEVAEPVAVADDISTMAGGQRVVDTAVRTYGPVTTWPCPRSPTAGPARTATGAGPPCGGGRSAARAHRSGAAPARCTKSILGCRYVSSHPRRDIARYAEPYRQGRLLLDELVTAVHPVEDFPQARTDAEQGRVARAVLGF